MELYYQVKNTLQRYISDLMMNNNIPPITMHQALTEINSQVKDAVLEEYIAEQLANRTQEKEEDGEEDIT